jgi:hypothetical protein
MDVNPRRFYEFWAIVETIPPVLNNPNGEFNIGIHSQKHDYFPLAFFIKL